MNIKSKNGKTAADLLKDRSWESIKWENLYRKVASIPEPDLRGIRNTLSVVAALLAIITFAAAFTIPGNFDQNNGDVLLRRKPAFIIFILLDTYAMCCSMVVLYALMLAEFWTSYFRTLKLVEYSSILLRHSFYGTLGAVMTGVYTMLSSKSIWVAIIVLFMCSTVMISARVSIRFKLVDRFIDKLSEKEAKLPV